jgi:hypothetical protein
MHTTEMSFKSIGRQMGYAGEKTSNHVGLNTMPNVFVDVGLPAVDV